MSLFSDHTEESECKVMNSVIYSQMVQENKKGRRENEKANGVKMLT